MHNITRLAAAAFALAAAAAPALAQTTVAGNTFGCFGAGCTPAATASFNPAGSAGSVMFTGASFTGQTNPFTGGFSVSNFGTFQTNGFGGSNFSTPFTLLFQITTPAGSTSPSVNLTVAGNLGTNAQTRDVSYTFTGAPASFTFPGGSGTVTIDNGFIGSNNAATITGRVTASSVVPEPSTYALLATGLVGLAGAVVRRRNMSA